MRVLNNIDWPGLGGLLEIAVLAVGVYYILLLLRGTRGAQVLSGLVLVIGGLLLVTYVFRLDTLTWLLQRFSVYLSVGFLIIFQPEIRRVLAELGRQHIGAGPGEQNLADLLVRSVLLLAEGKIGALIAVERQVDVRALEQGGTPIDGAVSPELLASIFYPHTPLHDGGVIVRGNRVAAAGCVFPLSQREGLSTQLGTRHRAAIGLSEESDALVLVVSEETGTISLAYRGRLRRGLDEERLRRILESFLGRRRDPRRPASFWQRLLQRGLTAVRPVQVREADDHV